MGVKIILLSWVFFTVLVLKSECYNDDNNDDGDLGVSVKFLKVPRAITNVNSATFVFEVFVGGNLDICRNCSVKCKLDDHVPSNCEDKKVSYLGLQDGNHTFEVCTNGSKGVGCATYNWNVDTVPPTAYIAALSFTNAIEISVNISFSEPCGSSGGGFQCSSINACNLLVYGAGQVMPSTLNILQPSLEYSLIVELSPSARYGRVILALDKSFCSDNAGNKFTRSIDSVYSVHFDRRSVSVNLSTHVPEKLLQLNGETRTVQATNSYKNLKVYLYFSAPVINSSAEIQSSLTSSQGLLVSTKGKSLGNRRFGFLVKNMSSVGIVTISLDSKLIISRQGTPVSPVSPVTFLYDSQRPAVRLSTTSNMRTREHIIPISIKFMKPVFDFNSSHISISGGHLESFRVISRSVYTIEVQAYDEYVLVNIPENITGDIAGNKNLPSNTLQLRHYSVPMMSSVLSISTTVTFIVTSGVAALLTVSTVSLQYVGAVSRPSSLTSHPARSLFRIACHIQVFAFSRWFAVPFPVEYYEFTRGLQWSIPYFNLPWETGHTALPVTADSNSPAGSYSYKSEVHNSGLADTILPGQKSPVMASSLYGLPLTPMEYTSFFESQIMKPEAEYIYGTQTSNRWKDFNRSMFWLGVIGGSLIILHVFLLVILKLRKKSSVNERSYGALTFPKFEIFVVILALPSICQASASLIKGGDTSGVIVGILLLGTAFFLLLAFLLFLTVGITFGKLLQYKELHKEGLKFHWYQEIIRVTLGPGKLGQWTWKNKRNSLRLVMFGPLYEDLRGPPKYMLSQIIEGNSRKRDDSSSIIDSEDENEDAEAPFIQKLFGILRIYYTLLETVKRVSVGIIAGAYYSRNKVSTKSPVVALLCITSFQLVFLILKKPFIKKKVQLVEIVSISSEVCLFTTCLVLIEKVFSSGCEKELGIFMVTLFLVSFIAQMINEWYALYVQTKQLDPAEKSFISGSKASIFGLLILFTPQKMMQDIAKKFSMTQRAETETRDPSSSTFGNSASTSSGGTTEKPWMKQLRELAKASFSGSTNDPSSSKTRWSGIWGGKKSGSSSVKSSTDYKSKPKLYKDLEAIFASKY